MVTDDRVGEVLERTASFYEGFLWESAIGESVRSRLANRGVDAEVLRAFGTGYAPSDWTDLLTHLRQSQFSEEELWEAGIAARSERGQLHVQFRSRVMFPVRQADGRIIGFAGMATHPGPSWPRWLTSPDRGRFRREEAVFGLDHAGASVNHAGEARVFDDCIEVLRAHQLGSGEAVAVIRSPITRGHLIQLAEALRVAVDELGFDPEQGLEQRFAAGLVIRPSGERENPGEEARASGSLAAILQPHPTDTQRVATPGPAPSRAADTGTPTDPYGQQLRRFRRLVPLGAGLIGVGLPLLWVLITQPDRDAPGGAATDYVVAVGGVAASYVLLTILVSLFAARTRARSRARRMRVPWERGATEWQPTGWTYHLLEEVLIAAALVSVVCCIALFLIGAFT